MKKVLGLTLSLTLLFHEGAHAQAGASLTGAVKDATGAVVPGATVTVRNTATGELRNAVSGDEGLYRITNLPRGTYDVTTELSGFRTVTQSGVLLTVGETVRLDFTLEIGAFGET